MEGLAWLVGKRIGAREYISKMASSGAWDEINGWGWGGGASSQDCKPLKKTRKERGKWEMEHDRIHPCLQGDVPQGIPTLAQVSTSVNS